MECLFKKEIEAGTMCCDFGGIKHESGAKQCPTIIFNQFQALGEGYEPIPETLTMCSDESWIRGLLSPTACKRKSSRAEAIEFIEEYKQSHHIGNERRSIRGEIE